ncbi:DUF4258 domain-containing protein [Candidatus Bathyarchaeota archaeon]|nr:DUF4258 domain-containing protein [Candidatus Bathyarchaeota archaeon]
MEVQFSRHALEKIQRRNVKVSDIYTTLRFPDDVYEDLEHGTSVAVKKVDAKFIIVIYRREDEVVKVITLYYTTKLDRLLKAKLRRGTWKKIE